MIIIKYPEHDLQAVSDDMTLNHDGALMGITGADTRTWLTTKGSVTMGYFPRGDNAPIGWTPTIYWTPGVSYKTDTRPWEAITPWYVASLGAAHTAINTGINISGITLQLYDKSIQAWRKVDTGEGNPLWTGSYNYSTPNTIYLGAATKNIESDGSWTITCLNPSAPHCHGGKERYLLSNTIADYNNIGGIFVTLKAKLALIDPDGIDDRHLAQILICAAADFWPEIDTQPADMGIYYIPNIAISRFRYVGLTTTRHYMATINPPAAGTGNSVYSAAGGIVKMPVATFESLPPPYLITA